MEKCMMVLFYDQTLFVYTHELFTFSLVPSDCSDCHFGAFPQPMLHIMDRYLGAYPFLE
jgi:hypothetical protein